MCAGEIHYSGPWLGGKFRPVHVYLFMGEGGEDGMKM